MRITIDTTEITDLDRQILSIISGGPTLVERPTGKAEEPASQPKKTQPKAEPKKAPKAAEKAEEKAPEPAPEPEPTVEAEAEAEAEVEAAPEAEPTVEAEAAPKASGETMEDAVKIATTLVSNGRAAEVKAALKSVDASRVSDIAPGKISDFIAALS